MTAPRACTAFRRTTLQLYPAVREERTTPVALTTVFVPRKAQALLSPLKLLCQRNHPIQFHKLRSQHYSQLQDQHRSQFHNQHRNHLQDQLSHLKARERVSSSLEIMKFQRLPFPLACVKAVSIPGRWLVACAFLCLRNVVPIFKFAIDIRKLNAHILSF